MILGVNEVETRCRVTVVGVGSSTVPKLCLDLCLKLCPETVRSEPIRTYANSLRT